MKLPLLPILLGVLCLSAPAAAQRLQLSLVGAATYTKAADRTTVAYAPAQAGRVWHRITAGADYQLGLRLALPLTEQLQVEAEPRYQRLRQDVTFGVIQGDAGVTLGGRVEGQQLQLPLGVRYTLSHAAQKPQLVARAVLGRSRVQPVAVTGGQQPTYVTPRPPIPLISAGYGVAEPQWQLGLEAGAGVEVLRRLSLSLLLYHGLAPTALLSTQGRVVYRDEVSGQSKSYQVNGQLRARLTTLSLQAALRLR
jgi:hypothetical protein